MATSLDKSENMVQIHRLHPKHWVYLLKSQDNKDILKRLMLVKTFCTYIGQKAIFVPLYIIGCNDCAASEPCSSYFLQVCLTCINAVSDDDCQQRGYYETCSALEVSTTTQHIESDSLLFSFSFFTCKFFVFVTNVFNKVLPDWLYLLLDMKVTKNTTLTTDIPYLLIPRCGTFF